MTYHNKTSKELISELQKLKQENASLKASHKLQVLELKRYERELQERVKELNCLYEIGRLIENEYNLDKILQGVADLIANTWYHPEIACARIVLDGREYQTKNFRKTDWRQSVDLQLHGQPLGIVELCYLEERPAMDEGPFLTQERELLNTIAKRLLWIFERSRTEEVLHESEEKYRRMFETMSTGVIYQAADGTIISANPASERILGLTTDQMMGKTSMDPRWKMIDEQGGMVPGSEHPAMQALKTGEKVGPVDRRVFIPEKNEYVWLSITAIPLFQPGEDKPFQAYATFDDITERILAEEALKQSEALNKTIMEKLPIGIAVNTVDPPVFTFMNEAFPKFYRTTREALSPPNSFWDVVYEDPEFREKIKTRVEEDCASNDPVRMHWEDVSFTRNGEGPYYICAQNIPLKGSDMVISTVIDVTERKKAEEELDQERRLLRTIIDSIPDSIYMKDTECRKLLANKSELRKTGFKQEKELIGKNDFDIWPPEIAQHYFEDDQRVLIHGESVVNREEKVILPDGEIIWQLSTKLPLYNQKGEIAGLVGIGRDITDRKLASDALEKLLEEKNVLLSEIHHRVKNNMAIISSLITLQTDYFRNENPDNLLLDIRARIDSMALVHEMVYEQQNFAGINFAKLLKRLIDHLQNIYRPKDKDISVQIRSDDTFLDMNKSVPLTLLICEMLTNAWKHAFTGRKAGIIELELKKSENKHYLVIQDDGVGVADMDQIHNANSLGWTIIHGLANQLHGDLSLSSPEGGGLRVEIRFTDTKGFFLNNSKNR